TSLSNTGAINIVSRSGGNGFHGSGFIFGRDASFAARTGNEAAPFDREQGGVRVGGPFVRDKLFWFANFEKNRTRNSVQLSPPAPFSSFDGFAAALSKTAGRVSGSLSRAPKSFKSRSYGSWGVS